MARSRLIVIAPTLLFLLCAATTGLISVAEQIDEDLVLGRYSGTWKLSDNDKGTVVLIIKDVKLGNAYKRDFEATISFEGMRDQFLSQVFPVTLTEIYSDKKCSIHGHFFEVQPGPGRPDSGRSVHFDTSSDKPFMMTETGLLGNGYLLVTYSPRPGVEQNVALLIKLEKE